MQSICPKCSEPVTEVDIFCPQCRARIKETDISQGQKIKIYTFSILLAPLGLYWFFKFFKSENINKKILAYRVLIITVIVSTLIIMSIAYTFSFYSKYINTNISNVLFFVY